MWRSSCRHWLWSNSGPFRLGTKRMGKLGKFSRQTCFGILGECMLNSIHGVEIHVDRHLATLFLI